MIHLFLGLVSLVVIVCQIWLEREPLALITIFALTSFYLKRFRRDLLSVACIVAGVLVVLPPGTREMPFGARIISYGLFLLFGGLVAAVILKINALRKHYFLALLGIYIAGILSLQGLTGAFGLDEDGLLYSVMLILMSFWFICDYLRHRISTGQSLSLLWIRPFWSAWVIPYDSPNEWRKFLDKPLSASETLLETVIGIKRVLIVFVITMIFENLVFDFRPLTADLGLVKGLSLPLTYRQGYSILIEENYSVAKILMAHFFSSVHFFAHVYFYSTIYILAANLGGIRIRPHVTDFWQANRFSDFYFRTTYHYSRVIKSHLFSEFVAWKSLKALGRYRNAILVFCAVFLSSEISLYIGRGISVGLRHGLAHRNVQFAENLQYSLLIAFVCAASCFPHQFKMFGWLPQKARFLIYLCISSATLFFGFHYLRTPIAVKMEIIDRIFWWV